MGCAARDAEACWWHVEHRGWRRPPRNGRLNPARYPVAGPKRRVYLLPHLVAARSRAGADYRHDLSPPAHIAQSHHTLIEHTGRQSTPARMQGGHRPLRAEHDGNAVGCEHHRPHPPRGDRVAVGLESRLALPILGRCETLAHAPHHGAVNLVAAHHPAHPEHVAQTVARGQPALGTLPAHT
jgi:hypothetical protein